MPTNREIISQRVPASTSEMRRYFEMVEFRFVAEALTKQQQSLLRGRLLGKADERLVAVILPGSFELSLEFIER